MKPIERGSSASRLRAALEMYRMGEEMMRLQLRRRYPRASEAKLAARLVEWLEKRPGAEEGDAQGSQIR